MKNAEVIANDLMNAIRNEDDELLECVADYISCPSEEECDYDGSGDYTPCVACKKKWLKKEFD